MPLDDLESKIAAALQRTTMLTATPPKPAAAAPVRDESSEESSSSSEEDEEESEDDAASSAAKEASKDGSLGPGGRSKKAVSSGSKKAVDPPGPVGASPAPTKSSPRRRRVEEVDVEERAPRSPRNDDDDDDDDPVVAGPPKMAIASSSSGADGRGREARRPLTAVQRGRSPVGRGRSPSPALGASGYDSDATKKRVVSATAAASEGARLHGRAAEIAKRREREQEKPPRDCTFRPKLTAHPKDANLRQKKGKDRLAELYEDSKDRERHRAEVATRHRDAECSFQPRMETHAAAVGASSGKKQPCNNHQPATSSKPRSSSSAGAARSPSPARRAEQLYQQARASHDRREASMRAAERPPPDCTFQPRIMAKKKQQKSARARSASPAAWGSEAARRELESGQQQDGGATDDGVLFPITPWGAPEEDEVHDRLYAAARHREQAVEQLKEASERVASKECTFRPRLRSRSPARRLVDEKFGDRSSVADRAEAFERRRLERIEQLREARDKLQAAEATFQPTINRARAAHAAAAAASSSSTTALTTSSLAALDDGASVASSAGAASSSGAASTSVFDRLAVLESARLKRIYEAAALRSDIAQYTFQPQTNTRRRHRSSAESVSSSDNSSSNNKKKKNDEGPVYDRLYESSFEAEARRAREREERRRAELAECSFAPKVPDRARQHDPEESRRRILDDHADLAAARDELKRARELDGCTFQPHAYAPARLSKRADVDDDNGDPDNNGPSLNNVEPVHDRLTKAAPEYARRLELKRERELEGCTFKPQVLASAAPTEMDNNKGASSNLERDFAPTGGEGSGSFRFFSFGGRESAGLIRLVA